MWLCALALSLSHTLPASGRWQSGRAAPGRAALRACAAPVEPQDVVLTPCGGVRKRVLQAAPEGALAPEWGSLVEVHFTGRFPNGTVFDAKSAEVPFEFQLNAGVVVDGMQKGVESMRVGERALLTCGPRWAYGEVGVKGRNTTLIPPNATLNYEVELLSAREGPLIENEEFDMETYKSSLSGLEAGRGRTEACEWSERGEELTVWLPLDEGVGSRDITCDFRPRELSVRIGEADEPLLSGTLKGRVIPDECYWVIDDEGPAGRALQLVLAKAGAFSRWDGVVIGETPLSTVRGASLEL